MKESSLATSRVVLEVREGEASQREVGIVREAPLTLRVNDQQAAIMMRMPGMEKELAVGFCVSEGLIAGVDDILALTYCGDEPDPARRLGGPNEVIIRVPPEALNADARLEVVRLIRAGCGAVDVDRAELPLPSVPAGPHVSWETLQGLGQVMREAQQLHREVGGVHAAALFEAGGALVVLAEDVGRHNAVDKATGHCLLRGIPLQDKLLLCSGRLSYEMVTKAIRVGLPMLLSFSAPTALAVEIGDRHNLTMIGYLRGTRMTVYTHPERVRVA
jgi:FdhD protein